MLERWNMFDSEKNDWTWKGLMNHDESYKSIFFQKHMNDEEIWRVPKSEPWDLKMDIESLIFHWEA